LEDRPPYIRGLHRCGSLLFAPALKHAVTLGNGKFERATMYQPDLQNWQKERARVLSESVHMVYANAVDGDIGEFGIATGTSIDVISATMKVCDPLSQRLRLPTKMLHAFDSFQGLPEAKLPEDVEMPLVKAGVWGKGKCSSPGIPRILEVIQQNLAPERINLYPGWFSETFPSLPESLRFSLAHIDCDLYESSKEVLDELFGKRRMLDGCILLLDDFICNRGSKKFGQRKAWEECVEKYKPNLTDLGFYGLGSWRCIVHIDE
jgi:hypothetical protein